MKLVSLYSLPTCLRTHVHHGSVPFMTRKESQMLGRYLAFRTSLSLMWKLLIWKKERGGRT